jgi:hypothetical protein
MTHPHDRALEAAARALDKYTFSKARSNTISRVAVSAYLAALQETHALVPREPTIGMLRALVASWPEQERAAIWTLGSFREDYRAMIDAAPPAAQDPRP